MGLKQDQPKSEDTSTSIDLGIPELAMQNEIADDQVQLEPELKNE